MNELSLNIGIVTLFTTYDTAMSYVVNTKSTGKRITLVLSTVSPILGVTKDFDKEKPAVIKLYDLTKGDTDIFDQRTSTYSVKPKSSKWTICTFSYMLVRCCSYKCFNGHFAQQ